MELTIRYYEDCDFEGVMTCIRQFYGDGYPYPEYLEREQLVKRTQQGDLLLTVALVEGVTAGIVGARRERGPLEDSIVLTLRNVRREYAGMGIASKQLDDLLVRMKARFPEATCAYADVMTHNCVSQNSLINRGYVCCGLRLMLYKNEIITPFLHEAPGTKMSQAVYVNAFQAARGEKQLFVPQEHGQITLDVYQKLGVPITMTHGVNMPDVQKQSELIRLEIPMHEKWEYFVVQIGQDMAAQMKTQKQSWSQNGSAVVYLNMLDAACPWLYQQLSKMGFYFSGFKPLNRGAEYILMAHTENVNQDFSAIQVGEEGAALLQYILDKRQKN